MSMATEMQMQARLIEDIDTNGYLVVNDDIWEKPNEDRVNIGCDEIEINDATFWERSLTHRMMHIRFIISMPSYTGLVYVYIGSIKIRRQMRFIGSYMFATKRVLKYRGVIVLMRYLRNVEEM